MSSVSFLTSLLFFLALATTTTITATYDLIDQTCQESSYSDPNINYTFCFNALQSYPGSNYASLARLGSISLTLVRKNVTCTKSLVNGLRKNTTISKSTKAALKDCSELYSDALPTLNEAISDYKAKRFDDANEKVSSVMDDSTTCGQGFEDVGVECPVTRENGYISQLCAIALSIMSKLKN